MRAHTHTHTPFIEHWYAHSKTLPTHSPTAWIRVGWVHFFRTTDKLKLKVSLCCNFGISLVTTLCLCSEAQKHTWLWLEKKSWFSLNYLFCLPRSQMEMVGLPVRNTCYTLFATKVARNIARCPLKYPAVWLELAVERLSALSAVIWRIK